MAKREPTIEQNSHFTAKTKEGQDVEFETTIKFYITPSGEVRLSAPGGQQPARAATAVAPTEPERQAPRGPPQESPPPKAPNTGQQETVQPKRRTLTDDTIDKAFPRGPEPSGECSMRQFIPDPCRAVDDAIRSIKSVYHNLFSGPRCPPPENTGGSLNQDYLPRYERLKEDYSEKPAEVVDNEENKNKEMENEQKYDM